MIDFQTGKSELRNEHKAWIDETVRQLAHAGQFFIYIYGFASKLGPAHGHGTTKESEAFNRQLSYDRASAAARYMETLDRRVSSRIREFSARGSADYNAPSTDDSAEQRAVEIHVYPVPVAPQPPANVDPVPPLPGGARYTSWAVAAPFSVTASIAPGAVAGVNVVVFRCHERKDETRTYVVPGVGGGVSFTGPKLGKLAEMAKAIFGTLSYSGMSFTDTTAVTPFNFGDLEGAGCALQSAGGGIGPGYQFVRVSASGKLWFRESSGKAMFASRDFVSQVNCSGKDLQLGIGASAVGGPMVRIA